MYKNYYLHQEKEEELKKDIPKEHQEKGVQTDEIPEEKDKIPTI